MCIWQTFRKPPSVLQTNIFLLLEVLFSMFPVLLVPLWLRHLSTPYNNQTKTSIALPKSFQRTPVDTNIDTRLDWTNSLMKSTVCTLLDNGRNKRSLTVSLHLAMKDLTWKWSKGWGGNLGGLVNTLKRESWDYSNKSYYSNRPRCHEFRICRASKTSLLMSAHFCFAFFSFFAEFYPRNVILTFFCQ